MKKLVLTELTPIRADESLFFLWERSRIGLDSEKYLKTEKANYLFKTKREQLNAAVFCKETYLRILPILTNQLNKIHSVDYSNEFWRTFFCFWLYRYICVMHDKFIALEHFVSPGKYTVNRLDPRSYFVPVDAEDSYKLMTTSFGVEQACSIYFELFHKNFLNSYSLFKSEFDRDEIEWGTFKNFEKPKKNIFKIIRSKINLNLCEKILDRIILFFSNHIDAEHLIVDSFFSRDVSRKIILKTLFKTKIEGFTETEKSELKKTFDMELRSRFVESISIENKFDKFLIYSLKYFIPTTYLENFKFLHEKYNSNFRNSKLKTICSEAWLGDEFRSLFLAIAKQKGAKHIHVQHGWVSMMHVNTVWLEKYICDYYLSTGDCKNDESKVICGGFHRALPVCSGFFKKSKDIVFFSTSTFPYIYQHDENLKDENFVQYLEKQGVFFSLLNSYLQEKIIYRPYPLSFGWENKNPLYYGGHRKPCVRIDDVSVRGLERMRSCSLVIFDVISTGYIEAFVLNVPTIIIFDRELRFFDEQKEGVFDVLADFGVVHWSVQSAASHLNRISDDIDQWWKSQKVQQAVQNFLKQYARDSSYTVKKLCDLYRSMK